MDKKIKAKLDKFKTFAKKHGPAVLGAVGTVVASAVALHYRNLLVEAETVDPNAWPTIEVCPGLMADVENGKTLRYREARKGRSFYAQQTTDDDFSSEKNAEFEEFKNQ